MRSHIKPQRKRRAPSPKPPHLPGSWQTRLVQAAARARRGAVAPWSGFKVGAALLTRGGKIITGANVESASYGLTCCAERVALFTALTAGERNFQALAVVSAGGATPCGACRQLLAEFAPEAFVWVAHAANLKAVSEFSVRALLPEAFRKFDPDAD